MALKKKKKKKRLPAVTQPRRTPQEMVNVSDNVMFTLTILLWVDE